VVPVASPEEVRAVEEAHRAAQAYLGITGAYLALRDWESVSPTAAAATSAGWLSRSLRMINGIRRVSRRLAIAYYQLARALESGRTLGLPETSDDPDAVTMGGLRKQYLDLLLEVAALGNESTDRDDPDERFLADRAREVPAEPGVERARGTNAPIPPPRVLDPRIQDWLDEQGDDDESPVAVDEYDWGEDLTLEQVERAFGPELRKEAIDVQENKAQRELRNEEKTPAAAVRAIEKEHDLSGSRGAGKVDQFGIEAGRRAIIQAVPRDALVKVVARGTGPDPCAFCAMLASRGFVYSSDNLRTSRPTTRTGRAAREVIEAGRIADPDFADDGFRKYHPNCHCYPIIGWRKKELPPLNAFFQQAWKDEVADKGYTGVDALNAWRRWINRRRREGVVAEAAA
jgi:hypothetical protein